MTIRVTVVTLAATDTEGTRYKISSDEGQMVIPSPAHAARTPEMLREMERLGIDVMEGRDLGRYAVTRLHPGSTPVWVGEIKDGWVFRV